MDSLGDQGDAFHDEGVTRIIILDHDIETEVARWTAEFPVLAATEELFGNFNFLMLRLGAGSSAAPETRRVTVEPVEHGFTIEIDGLDAGQFRLEATFVFDLFLLGDVNGDMKLTAEDAVILEEVLQGKAPAPSCVASADVNADGIVDRRDVAQILSWVTGKEPQSGGELTPEVILTIVMNPDRLTSADGFISSVEEVVGSITLQTDTGDWWVNEDLQPRSQDAVVESVSIKYTMVLTGLDEGEQPAR